MMAETMKCRRSTRTRWKKITDMAFSSTVKAMELKNTSTPIPTQPTTSRLARNACIWATRSCAIPGTTRSR